MLQDVNGEPPRDLEVHGIFVSPDGKSKNWKNLQVINGELETHQFAFSGPGTYFFMFTSILYPSNQDSLAFEDSTVYIKIPECPQNSVPTLSLDYTAGELDLDSVVDDLGDSPFGAGLIYPKDPVIDGLNAISNGLFRQPSWWSAGT